MVPSHRGASRGGARCPALAPVCDGHWSAPEGGRLAIRCTWPVPVPVPLENRMLAFTWAFPGPQAARSYSLIRPPRTGFRRIWQGPMTTAWRRINDLNGAGQGRGCLYSTSGRSPALEAAVLVSAGEGSATRAEARVEFRTAW